MHLISKSLPCVINMCRPFLILLTPLAIFLVPTDAWEASVSQNLSIAVTPNAPANAFYVATNGSDSNPGTLASPFTTLQKCQTAMRGSTTKTCYIRGGTYTNGNGWSTTNPGGGSYTYALYLTSADNGETWSYYPPDNGPTGASPVIIDGGSVIANAGVLGSQTCTGGTSAAMLIDGGSNITLNGFIVRNFRYGGVAIHGGNPFGDFFPVSVGQADSDSISNNIIYNACGADDTTIDPLFPSGINVQSLSTNATVTHNVVYNHTYAGIQARSGGNGCGSGLPTCDPGSNQNNLHITYNAAWHNCLQHADCGQIYRADDMAWSSTLISTGVIVSYNYIGDYGTNSDACGTAGCNTPALYFDDGSSNSTVQYNVVEGFGTWCFKHNGGANVNMQYNICEKHGGTYMASLTQGDCSGCARTGWYAGGNDFWQNGIGVGNLPVCGSSICIWNDQNATVTKYTKQNNGYYNYNAAGTGIMTADALNGNPGETNPTGLSPAPFSTCPGGNVDSWSYTLALPNASVTGSPVSYSQPSGWGTPGFWGPPGWTLNSSVTGGHSAISSHSPSYGPTC